MNEFVEPIRPGWRRATPNLPAVAFPLTACLLTAAAVLGVLADTPASTRNIAIPVFVVGAGALFGLGLYDIARERDVYFARALVVAGFLWSLSALSASHQPTLYSLGRIGLWLVELAIMYVLLAYPSGRLTSPTKRAVFAGGALLVGLLFLPTALFAPQFPHPSLWSECVSACPRNVFASGHPAPALVHDLVIPVRETLTVVLFVAVAGVVGQQMRNSGPLLRRTYAPIVAIAVGELVVFALYFPIRRTTPMSGVLDVLNWTNVLSLPAVALACGAGRLYRRVLAANAFDRIARDVQASATVEQVRRAMADALEDPSLRILHSFPGDSGAWVDESAAPVTPAQGTATQAVTEASSGNWRIAVVHDPSLMEARSLVHTAACYALAALENDRLSGDLRISLEQLAASRAHGIAAEDRERQKIERDLHDGAQQRLVAVRVKLALAADQLRGRDPAGAEVIRALGDEIDATIDEVRSFARGIYPPLLADTGLNEALRAIGRDAAVPTIVNAQQLGRYPREVETTVYFSCSEALQNAAKHARGVTSVMISVWQDRELHFEVRDDGAGFDVNSTQFGTGLSNLQERLAAVDGRMTVRSVPDQGTEIGGSIPLRRT